jgi:hypothetical protein
MEITWNIDSITCLAQVDEYTNVAYQTAWRTYATEGEYSTSVYGSVTLQFDPASDNFIPYEDLTEEIVLSWTFDVLGEEQKLEIEANVANALQNIITPKEVTNPLPWVSE